MKYLISILIAATLTGCVDASGDHASKSEYFNKQLLACKMAGYPRFTAHDVEVFCMKNENGSDVMIAAKELLSKEEK